jgi:hypothetical protein
MKRTAWILGSIVTLVLVLGIAAFIAGQMFQTQQQGQITNNNQGTPQMQVTPAAELPKEEPVAEGYADHRADNSIFLCSFSQGPTINTDGTVNKGGSCAGGVEVVITHDTKFFHDISAEPRPEPPGGLQPEDWIMQQVVEPGDVSKIDGQSGLQVWGEQTGNRIVAQTIVYWTARPASAAPNYCIINQLVLVKLLLKDDF